MKRTKKMGTTYFFLSSFVLILLLSFPLSKAQEQVVDHNDREALEIVIGGSDPVPEPVESPPESQCPEPPPPPPPAEVCPTPLPPPSPPPPSPPPPSPPPPSPPPPSPPPPSPPPPSPPPPPPPPPPSPRPEPSVSERVAMIAPVVQRFKARIAEGPKDVLASWTGKNVCKYKGFRCDKLPDFGNQNAVSGVDFNGFGFRGKGDILDLGGFLDKLEDIAFFHANSNNFTGKVPTIDYKTTIRFLYELDLSNNKLSGYFPREILDAKNLTFIDVRFNNYVGYVPYEVFTLDVEVIFLNNNKFTGQIPSNLGQTPALYLTFANNIFTGQIPSSIGQASVNLTEILLLNNKLSGCLPYEIGKLKRMTIFDASTNCITGPIPQSFACLDKIELLNLANNRLFGAVPESLCKLGTQSGNLENLTLSGNYFTQVGPECRKLIAKRYLDVDRNCILDLPNQRSKEECEKFFLRKLRCPDEKWMNYIPCRNAWYTGDELAAHDGRHLSSSDADDDLIELRLRRGSVSSSVTYGALKPGGRRP